MSGFDKAVLMRALQEAGWTRAENPDCDSKAGYCLIPPDDLWDRRHKQYYVYDARELHYYVTGERPWEEEE